MRLLVEFHNIYICKYFSVSFSLSFESIAFIIRIICFRSFVPPHEHTQTHTHITLLPFIFFLCECVCKQQTGCLKNALCTLLLYEPPPPSPTFLSFFFGGCFGFPVFCYCNILTCLAYCLSSYNCCPSNFGQCTEVLNCLFVFFHCVCVCVLSLIHI